MNMKKFIFILLHTLLVCNLGYSQTGFGYLNYRVVSTQYGNGTGFTHNGVTVQGHADSHAEFEAMLDVSHGANTLVSQGEVLAFSSQGPKGGIPPGSPADHYIAEYSGWFYAQSSGSYTFYVYSDDSSEVIINGQVVAGKYGGPGTASGNIQLEGDTWYPIKHRFHEYEGAAWTHLQVYSSMHQGYYYLGDPNQAYQVSNAVDPNIKPLTVNVDLDFGSSLNLSDISVSLKRGRGNGTYYFLQQGLSLDSNGGIDLTPNIDGTLYEGTNQRATTTSGNVEWCVVYDYDSNNKRYRVGIDKREFPTGFIFTDLKQLQLFDLWDGEITYISDDSAWANYYIYTETQFDFINSSNSSDIRDANGFYGIEAEFTFGGIEQYYNHKIDLYPTSDFTLLYDDIVTVTDVYQAFQELSEGGISGGLKGNLNGVQLLNGDIDKNGIFDFNDTFKLLQHLQGITSLVTAIDFQRTMRIYNKLEYESITTSNWNTKMNSTTFVYVMDLDEKNPTHEYNLDITWLGDVDLSHSAELPTEPVTSVLKSSKIKFTKKEESYIEFDIQNGEEILVTLKIPSNQKNIVGTQFRLVFDNTRLSFDRIEQSNTQIQNFSSVRTNYVNFGSISTDGSNNLNNGMEYKIYFKPNNSMKSILGLITLLKNEMIDVGGSNVEMIVK